MERFTTHIGRVTALPRVNVDTDQIIPKQFLRSIARTGFGAVLFHDWRYETDGALKPEFELNRPEAAHASVLLAGANFGCGSSREHATWALADFGFRCIIAESFGDIFQANCSQNGILPVTLPSVAVDELFRRCTATPGYELSIDLESQLVRDQQGFAHRFEIDPYRRAMLLSGQDEIGKTLMLEDRIAAHERRS
ncbi:MAG TPA: 3-isopropylmalate dehydratase small subunit [Gemmatimonadales bacterium]